jgi:hypothetical protein
MKPEEINVAIAEACGWQWYRIPQAPIHGPRKYRCLFLPTVHEIDQSPQWMEKADMSESVCNWQYMQKEGLVHNYYEDLNAIHEAEKTLSTGGRAQYIYHLQTLCGGQQFGDNYFATAPQRCEAFLKTVGKWVETKGEGE